MIIIDEILSLCGQNTAVRACLLGSGVLIKQMSEISKFALCPCGI